jgi:hypothetical protein
MVPCPDSAPYGPLPGYSVNNSERAPIVPRSARIDVKRESGQAGGAVTVTGWRRGREAPQYHTARQPRQLEVPFLVPVRCLAVWLSGTHSPRGASGRQGRGELRGLEAPTVPCRATEERLPAARIAIPRQRRRPADSRNHRRAVVPGNPACHLSLAPRVAAGRKEPLNRWPGEGLRV